MNYFNFKISSKKGQFYLSSKEPREGYEKVEYGTPVKVTYHKYIQKLHGVVDFFGVKEVTFEGKTLKFLQMSLKSGDDLYQISTNLNNQKGSNYSDEAKAMIGAMRGYKKGEEVTASLYYKTSTGSNGKEYRNCNFYLNYTNILNDEGKGQTTGFISHTEIPKAEVEEVAGESIYTFKAQKNFYYEILQKLATEFVGSQQASFSKPNAEAPSNTPKPVEMPKADPVAESIEDHDSLPF